jgi:pentose-5-phosphate-3-epimerase
MARFGRAFPIHPGIYKGLTTSIPVALTATSASQAKAAGANVFVSGSGIFGKPMLEGNRI